MANKIKKVTEEVVEEVEGVVVRFLGHVRHNGKDYHAGDTAEIAPEHASALIDAHAAEAAVAVEPAPAPEGDPAPDPKPDDNVPPPAAAE